MIEGDTEARKGALRNLLRESRKSRIDKGPPAAVLAIGVGKPKAEPEEAAEGEPCPHCAEPCVECEVCGKDVCPGASECPHCGASMGGGESAPEMDEDEEVEPEE